MSRRLGDDPLTRARNARIKAAQATAPDSGSGTLSTAHASYNDVFFQRRAEGIARQGAEARAPQEKSEISEISEIPEIREVAAAQPVQADLHVTAEVKAAPEVRPAPQVSFIEEVVATLNGTVTIPAAPAVNDETPRLPAVSQAPGGSSGGAMPEAQKSGGFFKRLFGKFK